MTESKNVRDSVLGWLHKGYPHGVPQTDYFAVLALLTRTLSEDEVVKVAQAVLKTNNSDSVTPEDIHRAIEQVVAKQPNPEEIYQVAARLASVGWPLAVPAS